MNMTIPEILGIEQEKWRRLLDNMEADTYCCKPGIVQSFDGNGTVTVLLAIREKVVQTDRTIADTPFPVLVDVPVLIPRAGQHFRVCRMHSAVKQYVKSVTQVG